MLYFFSRKPRLESCTSSFQFILPYHSQSPISNIAPYRGRFITYVLPCYLYIITTIDPEVRVVPAFIVGFCVHFLVCHALRPSGTTSRLQRSTNPNFISSCTGGGDGMGAGTCIDIIAIGLTIGDEK